jgi:hypothetical protein
MVMPAVSVGIPERHPYSLHCFPSEGEVMHCSTKCFGSVMTGAGADRVSDDELDPFIATQQEVEGF